MKRLFCALALAGALTAPSSTVDAQTPLPRPNAFTIQLGEECSDCLLGFCNCTILGPIIVT